MIDASQWKNCMVSTNLETISKPCQERNRNRLLSLSDISAKILSKTCLKMQFENLKFCAVRLLFHLPDDCLYLDKNEASKMAYTIGHLHEQFQRNFFISGRLPFILWYNGRIKIQLTMWGLWGCGTHVLWKYWARWLKWAWYFFLIGNRSPQSSFNLAVLVRTQEIYLIAYGKIHEIKITPPFYEWRLKELDAFSRNGFHHKLPSPYSFLSIN